MTNEELIAWLRSLKGLGLSSEAADRMEALAERLSQAYTERSAAAVAMARFALMCGHPAGVGKDGNENWDDEWRVVLYVETPAGQVSWHIAPSDQHFLDGIPQYSGEWDGTFRSRDGSYCAWDHATAEALEKENTALKEHVAALLAEQECGCGYDKPTDVCLGHLPLHRKTVARAERLEALLREARSDLEVYITHEYPKDEHPYYERMWNLDMELCRRIDAALKGEEAAEARVDACRAAEVNEHEWRMDAEAKLFAAEAALDAEKARNARLEAALHRIQKSRYGKAAAIARAALKGADHD